MILTEKFQQFTVYKNDVSSSFVYAHFDNPTIFMEGLSEYILNESNLLNYANNLTTIEFEPTPRIYKKLYDTLGSFLNSELELLTFDNVTGEVLDILGQEYRFIDDNGETLLQKDKIGKIGEYVLHLLLTTYYNVHCIIPKFRCTTNRNMSIFGIDALFFNPDQRMIYFGESKVCKSIENAITLVNRSFKDYEHQISEEYRLVLSNEDGFRLSHEFEDLFKEYTEVCFSFDEFIEAAAIEKICVPAFLAHGNSSDINTPESFLEIMNQRLKRKQLFGLETEYVFISLPLIDKDEMMNILMQKVVKKSNDYRNRKNNI